ncbi:hypothetical protein WICMUC_003486 [Wickerhamomyces mucosus]|uniref:Uncharacterized protein n=1 Tax=Wickerhamomyces mucosus TaxID=1378264 RepID=A0A9P8TBU4_9ASCO|nr:hypothetical protein WICMUC_003486 [Wickerhamomyces mucosus]
MVLSFKTVNNKVKWFGIRSIHSTNIHHAVKVLRPNTIFSTELELKYRLGYDPIYISPAHKLIATLKRASLGFGLIGIYISQLMTSTPLFSLEVSYFVTVLSIFPLPLVHLFTKDYVSRIFRIYDTSVPIQNLESLVKDESLILEKISLTGRSTTNSLVKVQDLRKSYTKYGRINWKDKSTGLKYYVVNDVGGIKMDRIWGILEKSSGIDNGRFVD